MGAFSTLPQYSVMNSSCSAYQGSLQNLQFSFNLKICNRDRGYLSDSLGQMNEFFQAGSPVGNLYRYYSFQNY